MQSKINDDFGKKIIIIAKEKFGSQKALAEALKLRPSTISDWVNGRAYPSFTILRDLCIKAEISLDWLVLGKSFEEDSLNLDLFDEVFKYAYELAEEEDLPINGSYFLGVYDLVNEELKKGSKLSVKQIIDSYKKKIIRLRKL